MRYTGKIPSEDLRLHWMGCYGPSWRWRRAQTYGRARFDRSTDRDIADAVHYLRLEKRNPRRAEEVYPDIAAADQLQRVEAVVELLQLLSLARVEAQQIAQRANLPPPYVVRWQRLFFDLPASAKATDWVSVHVLQPMMGLNPLCAVKMRLAYFGGQTVLDEILKAETAYSGDPAKQLAAIRLRYGLEMEAALDEIAENRDKPDECFRLALQGWLAMRESSRPVVSTAAEAGVQDGGNHAGGCEPAAVDQLDGGGDQLAETAAAHFAA